MNYIYHVNGEKREPTKEEWSRLAERMLTAAGLAKTDSKGVVKSQDK